MWGWVGEIAKIFQGLGLPGAVIFALLIIVFMQYRMNTALLKSSDKGRDAFISLVENNTNSQLEVATVLSRLQATIDGSVR